MRKLVGSLVALLLLMFSGALIAACAGDSSDPPQADARPSAADARTGGAADAAPPTADAAPTDAAP